MQLNCRRAPRKLARCRSRWQLQLDIQEKREGTQAQSQEKKRVILTFSGKAAFVQDTDSRQYGLESKFGRWWHWMGVCFGIGWLKCPAQAAVRCLTPAPAAPPPLLSSVWTQYPRERGGHEQCRGQHRDMRWDVCADAECGRPGCRAGGHWHPISKRRYESKDCEACLGAMLTEGEQQHNYCSGSVKQLQLVTACPMCHMPSNRIMPGAKLLSLRLKALLASGQPQFAKSCHCSSAEVSAFGACISPAILTATAPDAVVLNYPS